MADSRKDTDDDQMDQKDHQDQDVKQKAKQVDQQQDPMEMFLRRIEQNDSLTRADVDKEFDRGKKQLVNHTGFSAVKFGLTFRGSGIAIKMSTNKEFVMFATLPYGANRFKNKYGHGWVWEVALYSHDDKIYNDADLGYGDDVCRFSYDGLMKEITRLLL